MIEVDQERDGRWTVQFVSRIARSRMIVHRAIALTEAMRVVRGKLENDMMGLEAQLDIGGTWPSITNLPSVMRAELDEMSEAVDRLDAGLDEEIAQRRWAAIYRSKQARLTGIQFPVRIGPDRWTPKTKPPYGYP